MEWQIKKGFITKTDAGCVPVSWWALIECNRNLTTMIKKERDPTRRKKLKRIQQANTLIIKS